VGPCALLVLEPRPSWGPISGGPRVDAGHRRSIDRSIPRPHAPKSAGNAPEIGQASTMELMGDTARGGSDVVAERLGADRAVTLRAELAAHELAIVDSGELADLIRKAAAYGRLAALVDNPELPGA